ncbi:alpha/beta fold hydrolase [Synechococcales cyanobacterium C]|uniref:Alpha/beta fold hydrolase n=1 Tax=Petrachloros mirabilis ULC683 TaxID=2781853 RepID=A0A8K1ZXM4_9CYAN|nr:alpha/beta fold hydrolase [Petrachloros mirabilis]NCJ05768.1 alpha/beta fold hydrolase [Petrachloros mirabilis ULC683]
MVSKQRLLQGWMWIRPFLLAYGASCLFLYFWQARMIFFPTANLVTTPAAHELPYKDIWLTVPPEADTRIHGWWIPAQPETEATLLYLHGNGGNISANLGQAYRFQQMGLSVFLFDYRGYGLSNGGFPSEAKVCEDAQRAWDYLTQERQIPPEHIVVYGHSLGGAVAVDLLEHRSQAAGLIVESSFTSIADVARRQIWPRIFPVNWLLHQRFDSLRKVPHLQVPTLYLHGTADLTIPVDMSQSLYAATPEPRNLHLVEGGNHNNLTEVGGRSYEHTLRNFVRQVLDASASETLSER